MVSRAVRRTAFVTDERYFLHHTDEGFGPWVAPGPALETPESKKRLRDLLLATGLMSELVALEPRPLTRADAERFHEPAYLDSLERLSGSSGGNAGEDTWFGPGGYEVALLAAGGTYEAVRAVVAGEVDNAYALVRPPGHHAERHWGRGYCLLGNVALAVLKARAELGVGRVAVLDWDVHHGNGTEQAFYADPDVLTVSLHQDRLYPQSTGLVEHRGSGAGVGTTCNVPLPAGSGRGAYIAAYEQVVEPVVRAFGPDLIVVACGFDAACLDPLGRMMLSPDAFGELARRTRELADELCAGRLALSHEGGYSELMVPFCGLAVLEELSGASAEIEDPFAWVDGYAAQALAPHQQAAVDAAAAPASPAG